MRSRGFKLALLAGLGVGAVVGVAALKWKDIAVQYHLGRLRRDPDYLLKIVEGPEGSPERQAIRAFLRTAQGKEEYSTLIVVSLFDRGYRLFRNNLRESDRAILGFDEASAWCSQTSDRNGLSMMAVGFDLEHPLSAEIPTEILPALGALMKVSDVRGFKTPKFPRHQFSTLRGVDALKTWGLRRPEGEFKEDEYVFFMERIAPEPLGQVRAIFRDSPAPGARPPRDGEVSG